MGIALTTLLCASLSSNAAALTFTQAPGSPYPTTSPAFVPNSGGFLGGLVAGDFNSDGVTDLAVVNGTGVPPMSSGESVTVFLGNQSGGLTVAPGSPVGIYSGGNFASTGAIATGDFNGDGHLDLAVVDETHHTVSILLGNGTGGFALSGAPIAFAGGDDDSLAVGDFNGDRREDIAVVNADVNVLLGNGSGGFAQAPGSPLTLPAFGTSAVAGGFTGAQRSDLAVGDEAGEVRVYLPDDAGQLQLATGSPLAIGATPRDLATADVNGDGKLDLVTANPANDTAGVLLGTGSGSFVAAAGSPIPVPSGSGNADEPGMPESIGIGDFECSGRPDLAVANFNGSSDNVAVLQNDGSGGFAGSSGLLFPVNGNPRSLVVGDFNGDGAPDIAVANPFLGRVTVLTDTASGAACVTSRPCPEHPNGKAGSPKSSTGIVGSPVVESLKLTARQVHAKRGIAVSFTLSSPGRVVVQLEKSVRRRVHGRPLKALELVGSYVSDGTAGSNSVTIRRVHGRPLTSGNFVVIVFTTLGNEHSAARKISLTVLR